MKKDIHPTYHSSIQVKCVCGNTFEAGSTQEELRVELCSACHPFYTGKQKLVDTAKRVEKFQAKVKAQKEISPTKKGRKLKREEKGKKDQEKQEKSEEKSSSQ